MNIFRPENLSQLAIITPKVFEDARGFFFELFNQNALQNHGLNIQAVQTNVSHSSKGVLRGLHYQWPNPQGKLVTCLQGEIWDVAVDIRPASPTFGLFHFEILSSENKKLFWIPEGYAHGFLTLSDSALVCYHTTAPYSHPDDRGIRFDDPQIAIPWPTLDVNLSEKDEQLPILENLNSSELPTIVKPYIQ